MFDIKPGYLSTVHFIFGINRESEKLFCLLSSSYYELPNLLNKTRLLEGREITNSHIPYFKPTFTCGMFQNRVSLSQDVLDIEMKRLLSKNRPKSMLHSNIELIRSNNDRKKPVSLDQIFLNVI